MVATRISPENAETFYHGRKWTRQRSDGSQMTGEVNAHAAETELRFDAVVDGQLATISAQAQSIVQQMEAHFMRTLYETVSNAVEEVGNVVDAKGKAPAAAFLEALRKIEFGVDRKGHVTRPELHLHPDSVPNFVKALEAAGPEFQAEVDRVTAEKEADALAREKARRSRFKPSAESE